MMKNRCLHTADIGFLFQRRKNYDFSIKKGADEKKVESLKQQLKDMGLGLHLSDGTDASLIGLIGDTTEVDAEWLGALDVIESVKRIKEPYKKANKDMHPNDTIIDVSGRKI